VLYVFKTTRGLAGPDGSPVMFEPRLIDEQVGIGSQIAARHINTDGILDLCIASKLGLYVFFGTVVSGTARGSAGRRSGRHCGSSLRSYTARANDGP